MNKIQKIGKENTYLLINGDGRDLSMIKDKSIDGIITDHPYDLQKALTGGNRKFATFELFRYESKDFKEKQRQKRDIFTKNSQYYYKLLKIFFRLQKIMKFNLEYGFNNQSLPKFEEYELKNIDGINMLFQSLIILNI